MVSHAATFNPISYRRKAFVSFKSLYSALFPGVKHGPESGGPRGLKFPRQGRILFLQTSLSFGFAESCAEITEK